MDTLTTALWLLAGFGLTVLLVLAALGGSLILQAIRFAVTLAFAEHKWKKLRKASAEAKAEVLAKGDKDDKND